jgi:ketosteroid isomerase-like protein
MRRRRKPMKRVIGCLVCLGGVLCSASGATAEDLRPATPVRRSIAPNETHDYTFAAQPGQRLHVSVGQLGVDVVVLLFGPDGKKLAEVDGPTGATGVEHLIAFTREAGTYRVSVVPFQAPDAKPGEYEIRLVDLRPATEREIASLRGEDEIAGVERQWEDAVQADDTAAMAKLMADDFASLGNTAADARTKEQQLEVDELSRKTFQEAGATSRHDLSEHVIRVFGDTAVGSGRATISTKAKGTALEGRGQFVHVWQKQGGQWKLVADHYYAYGRPPSRSARASVDPKVLGAYAGSYRDEGGLRINVTPAADALVFEWIGPFGSGKQEFPAASDTTFVASDGREATFVRSPMGDVTEIIILSNGPATRAWKTPTQ